MTKTECLKRIYNALGGIDTVIPHDDTVCELLHKIGDCVGDLVEELETTHNYTTAMHDYTTEEVVIGKWKDGKPIYRKVLESTVGTIQDDLNALGADKVTNFFGEALSNYGNWFLIPCKNPATIDYGNADNYSIAIMQSNLAHRQFQIQFGAYYGETNAVNVIIEYTKKGGAANE